MKSKSKHWLFLVLLFASFLRLWQLDKVPVSLFGDELDVGYHAYSILKTGRDYSGNLMPLHFQSLAEWRTPLYLYATVPTVAIFGINAWGVRLPAAFFGILGVWGMYALTKELLLRSKMETKNVERVSLLSALVLTFSPWHIQYSRAAFEVTMLLSFYLYGLYYFFKSIRKKKDPLFDGLTSKNNLELQYESGFGGKYLWIAVLHLVLTPLIYSTAKLFTPFLLVVLFLFWKDELLALKRKYIAVAIIMGLVAGLPTAYATLYTGGTQRFSYISVFTDPTRETEVGVKRENAAHFRGETGVGLTPTITDKIFYNKYTFWGQRILKNYFEPLSSEFFFIKGDLNLRHSIEGIGQFYKTEAIALILGLVIFFSKFKNRKIKIFIALWILVGILPAAITRDGGRHATRLITLLPPLIFLIAYGVNSLFTLKRPFKVFFPFVYFLLFAINFIFYQKNYWTENPWYSERWWHAGYKEAIEEVKELESGYKTILITDKNEPPWTFFAAYYNYDPSEWQKNKPDANWIDTQEFGRVTRIGKFIFGSPEGGLYDWEKTLPDDTLFMASEKEVKIDLIKEPDRTPGGLHLIKAISYPSGLPAFYLFEKNSS